MIEKIIGLLFLFCILSVDALESENFWDTQEGGALYEKATLLYENIERENAHTVQVNGITMSYLDFGPKDGMPLIWAHGSGSSGYEILNVKEGLVEAGYRIIAIDYRGHGKTQVPITGFNTSLYHVADDIACLLDQLSIQRAVIGGLSKGGFIAAAFYDEYPERVLGLLLEDGGSWSHLKRNDELYLADGATKYELIRDWVSVVSAEYNSKFDAFKAVASAYGFPFEATPTPESTVMILAMVTDKQNEKWMHNVDVNKLMVGDGSAYRDRVYSKVPMMERSQLMMMPTVVFRNLHVPMHIIDPVSANDSFNVSEQNKALQAQHPALIVHQIYEDTPHVAHIKRPEWFVESAKDFLKKVKVTPKPSSIKND